jgi:hypothetical protein
MSIPTRALRDMLARRVLVYWAYQGPIRTTMWDMRRELERREQTTLEVL